MGGGEGGGSRKTQDIGDLPKRGELRQFAYLRESWQKRGGGVFEEGLILQCTLCVVSMVDTPQSGSSVVLCYHFIQSTYGPNKLKT